MADRVYNVLFLCTGNSARSILGEAILAKEGQGRFRAFSAGSQPKGAPHPLALELLRQRGHDTSHLRSKSWDEFAGPDAPPMDFIFTVCGNAAAETCPVWPGHPATAHWGLADPAGIEPVEVGRRAFAETYDHMQRRIRALLALPDADLTPQRLRQIGES